MKPVHESREDDGQLAARKAKESILSRVLILQ